MDNDQRPTVPKAEDTAEIPWARTTTLPTVEHQPRRMQPEQTVQPGHPVQPGYAAPSGSAPAVAPPVWSGKKTAIAAALAIGFASVGAVGAAAVLPDGSSRTVQRGQVGQQNPAAQLNQSSQGGTRQVGGTRHFVGRVPGGSDDDGGGGDDD